jgi:undecaprenyl-diphosphatase
MKIKTSIRVAILSLAISFASFYNVKAQNWDIQLLDRLNSSQGEDPDKGLMFVSKNAYLVDFATPMSVILTGVLKKDKELTNKGLVIGASYLGTAVLTTALKGIFKRPRPYESYPELIYPKSTEGSYSFPSGHTSSAFSTATSLTLAFPKWYVAIPAFSYAGAVGYSRLDLGVHYPSDVLAGALLG